MERGSKEKCEASLLTSLDVDTGRKELVIYEAMVETGSRGPQCREEGKVREQEREGCWAEQSDSCSPRRETEQCPLSAHCQHVTEPVTKAGALLGVERGARMKWSRPSRGSPEYPRK